MKKQVNILVCIIILVTITAGAIAVGNMIGQKPFELLDKSDILCVQVSILPPDKSVVLYDGEKIQQFVDILKTVVVYGKDASADEYAGQLVHYTLTMNDGSEVKVGAYNPFVSINGVCYRAKYKSGEALNAFGNQLVKSYLSDNSIGLHEWDATNN